VVYLQKNALHKSVTEEANLEDNEEELIGEYSPIRDCLPSQSFKSAMAAICLFPFELLFTLVLLCYNIFSACLTKRILPSKVNTSFSLLAY
jgi:hypothetical protein